MSAIRASFNSFQVSYYRGPILNKGGGGHTDYIQGTITNKTKIRGQRSRDPFSLGSTVRGRVCISYTKAYGTVSFRIKFLQALRLWERFYTQEDTPEIM